MQNMRDSAALQDGIAGGLISLFGVVAAYLAMDYQGASGGYPATLGLTLAALGLVMILRAVRRDRDDRRVISTEPRNALISLGISACYLALVPMLGFYTSGLILMVAMPVALGMRRLVFSLVMAIAFIAFVWLVFAFLIEKPLPAEFFL